MAAQVRIVFTPVLNALKSGLARARAMIQDSLATIQTIPLQQFGTGKLTGEMAQLTPVSKNVATSIKGLRAHFAALAASQVTVTSGASKFISAIGAAGASMSKLGKGLTATGRRMSWFAFRLIMFGKMFQKFLMAPIKKGLSVFKTWDKSITQIATSMGFLAASGMLTADMQGTMLDVMGALPSLGMQVQGMLGAMAMLFGQIGMDVIPALIPPIVDLISTLSQLWSENKDKLIPILENIGDLISNKLIPLFQESGAAILEGLVKGLEAGIGALVWFMDVLKPHLPTISYWIGLIAGAAPILIALGTAIFIGATALAGLGMALGAVGKIFGIVKFIIIALGVAVSVLGAPITAIILVLAALGLAWATNFGNIRGIVKGFFDWFSGIFEGIATMLGGIGDKIKDFFDLFRGGKNKVKDFKDTHDDLMDGLNDAYGDSIGKDMKKQWGIAGAELKDLMQTYDDFGRHHRKVVADLDEPVGGKVIQNWADVNTPLPANVEQNIDITIEMNIETLSADTDIDVLVDEISRKLAEKIENIG